MNVLVFVILCCVEFILTTFAIIIFRSGLRERLNRAFFFFLVAFIIWALLNYLSNIANFGFDILILINRLLFASSFAMFYLLACFIAAVTNRHFSKFLFYLSSFIAIAVALFSMNSMVVENIVIDNPNAISIGVEFGPMAIIYFIAIFLVFAYIILELIFGISRSNDHRVRASSKILLFTIGIAVIAMILTNVVLPTVFNIFNFSILGMLFGALVTGGVGYSVVRHGLFDVRLAAIRSVAYALVLVTLAGIYLIIAFAFSKMFNSELAGPSQTMSGVGISLLLALIFQPIKRFFDKLTNKFFYKDNYSSDDFFARLNKILSSTIDLRALIERIAIEIGSTIKGEQAFLFIYTDNGHYMSAGTPGHKQLPKPDADQLKSEIIAKKDIIIASLLEDNDSIKRLMISHRIELIMPLVQDEEIVGYLCLGEHKTSNYTNRDIKVLNTISNELIIAIQNALAVQEIREFNETLKQRIANATVELRTSNRMLRQLDKAKDEFVGMASHQLRTPLTSVKGYISMVIDGDAGKITDSQKQLLDEAFKSSERMVNLINDFLNVSRIQTGKFMLEKSPVDLSKLVEQEIDSLQSNATAHNLKFIYKQPKDFPMIDMDESKIHQVVMNFIDNSIYYSHENATVAIKLLVESGEAVFKVEDSGIGVPVSERNQLFTKFYRASNARIKRPDGTGVGLYLAKKIIDAHDGKIIFSSNEGGGSTFGFRLPIK